jgi:hypothetical protein
MYWAERNPSKNLHETRTGKKGIILAVVVTRVQMHR